MCEMPIITYDSLLLPAPDNVMTSPNDSIDTELRALVFPINFKDFILKDIIPFQRNIIPKFQFFTVKIILYLINFE